MSGLYYTSASAHMPSCAAGSADFCAAPEHGDYAALGLNATGNRIDAMAFQLYRVGAGLLGEHWEVADLATIMRQLKD
ncbi:ester cyclase [Lysobacter niastensis]|uniref:Ester cyclase n=1 Tax=Lysobacter niastensis TaxID=380629 RepID=A0ABS0B996_9GAMM|nr:ester cyclase [Lysobacter niastensis]MBF6025412.1 ester cyclase [Lysobacter niastensis]